MAGIFGRKGVVALLAVALLAGGAFALLFFLRGRPSASPPLDVATAPFQRLVFQRPDQTGPARCFARLEDGAVLAGPDSAVVQEAVTLAPVGSVVQLAGECTGATQLPTGAQLALIDVPLTLLGGFSAGDWANRDPAAHPTVLDAGGGGRVLHITAAGVTVDGLIFTGGNSEGDGGAILANGALTVTASIFRDNRAAKNGGAVHAADLLLYDSAFERNRAEGWWGGGVFAAHLVAGRNTFLDNVAYAGGAIYLDGWEPLASHLIVNSLFIDNAAANGAAIYANQLRADLLIRHVTVVGRPRESAVSVGLLPLTEALIPGEDYPGGVTYIDNSIFSGNIPALAVDGEVRTPKLIEDYNLFATAGEKTASIQHGADSLLGEPHHVDPLAGNFQLRIASPAYNSAGQTSIEEDLLGNVRPALGGVDRGALELQPVGQLVVAVAGSGVVAGEPAPAACAERCSLELAPGQPVTLTAAAGDGALFIGWQGECSGSEPCVAVLRSSGIVTALFAMAPTPLPTATSSPTATPEPTATTTKEPTATPTKEPTATATTEPAATGTKQPTATATREPTPTKEPTATATTEPTATATKQPTATATREPTPTKEPTATATTEPTATATKQATATLQPTKESAAAATATVTATGPPVSSRAPVAPPARPTP